MTALGVRRLWLRLGWSRLQASAYLGLNEKTIRRWNKDGAPPHASRVLTLLAAGKISKESAAVLLSSDYERRLPVAS